MLVAQLNRLDIVDRVQNSYPRSEDPVDRVIFVDSSGDISRDYSILVRISKISAML